jgi:cathepsin L
VNNRICSCNGYKSVTENSESKLQEAVVKQPVCVSIDASHSSFQNYASGIYYEPRCSCNRVDHAVLLVGYGTANGQDYWIVKNSWGTTWGEKGYIRMSRNKKNNCCIAGEGVYPVV